MNKTNAMRLLERAHINYETAEYTYDENDLSGVHAAEQIKCVKPEQCFKTLVARGERKGLLVFCIPVAEELDLKLAAAVAGDKRVELIHVKELMGLTGYIRGGCSPIGMRKLFPTYIDETAAGYDKIGVSGGMRGLQVILNPKELVQLIKAEYCTLTR